jgi:excisionase family DNA binding protein
MPETPEKLERLYYSVKEAAEITGLCEKTIYNLIAQKELPVTCVGTRRLIPARALSPNSFGQKRFHRTHGEGGQ